MSIAPYAAGAVGARHNTQSLIEMRAQMTDLKRQLSSGKKAESFGALGFDRRLSLDTRAKLSELSSWQRNISQAELRLTLMTNSLTTIDDVARKTRDELAKGAFAPESPARLPLTELASQRLATVVDQLNEDFAGSYLFSGRASDTRPVASVSEILDGADGAVGLRSLIAERLTANGATASSAMPGRLLIENTGGPPPSISFAPQASADLGLRITSMVADPGFATIDMTVPPRLTLGASPPIGETVTIVASDALGNEYRMAFAASTTAGTGRFVTVPGDPAQTTVNLTAAIKAAIGEASRDALAPRVVEEVVAEFFDPGFTGNPVRRVEAVGDPAVETLVAGNAAQQVQWYRGERSASADDEARTTAPVRIGATEFVGLGARADESGIRSVLVGLATLSLSEFTTTPFGQEAYRDLADKAFDRLMPDEPRSVRSIAVSLGTAAEALRTASERHAQTRLFLENLTENIEGISNEAVASEILALQTRLESSYRTTALLSQLSLVNFL